MGPTYTFICRTCGEQTLVDEVVRDLLLDCGCVVCGTPIVESAFEAVDERTR